MDSSFSFKRSSNRIGWLGVIWLAVFMLGCTVSAQAWGPVGHRLVAQIAEQNLSPSVLEKIQSEFNILHLQDVANWADRIKGDRPETRPWHYTNIPEGEWVYKRDRDCPSGDCVTEIIPKMAKILSDPSRTEIDRLEALMFLVHFVADVHQPMHLGNPDDRGGNEISVYWNGERTNLHALWDHGLISLEGKSVRDYGLTLAGEIETLQRDRWQASGVLAWSVESRELALRNAYPLKKNGNELASEYMDRGRRIVRQQLQKAGVRLAALLNHVLAQS